MDETEVGTELRRQGRDATNFVTRFREENCRTLSNIARCACLQEEGRELFSIGQGALWSEPWSDVLVRAFTAAGAILLEDAALSRGEASEQNDASERTHDCIKALQYLGRRSDKALSTATILQSELRLLEGKGGQP